MIEEPKPVAPTGDEDAAPRSSSALLADGWTRLLSSLDGDPIQAGRKYEDLRARLIDLARWRGARVPEDVVDEAFERAAKRMADGEIMQLSAFLAGVIRHVVHEEARATTRQVALERTHAAVAPEADGLDQPADRCIARCLDEQPTEQRDLLLRYLGRERGQAKIDQRAALAAELGLTAGALRMKVYRIRVAVEACVRTCLGDEGPSAARGDAP